MKGVVVEWRLHDRAELFVIWPEHGSISVYGEYRSCDRCHEDADDLMVAVCEQEITDAYRNLVRNLGIVIALAAAAQEAGQR